MKLSTYKEVESFLFKQLPMFQRIGPKAFKKDWNRAVKDGWVPGKTLFDIEEAVEKGFPQDIIFPGDSYFVFVPSLDILLLVIFSTTRKRTNFAIVLRSFFWYRHPRVLLGEAQVV